MGSCRLRADRPGVHRAGLLPPPPLGGRPRLRRGGLGRHQPRPGQSEAPRRRKDDPATPASTSHCRRARAGRGLPRPQRARAGCRRADRRRHALGQRPGPAHQPGQRGLASSARGPRAPAERGGGPPPRGRTHPRPAVRLPRRARAWPCSRSTWPSTGPRRRTRSRRPVDECPWSCRPCAGWNTPFSSGIVIALARPVGLYVARVFEGKPTLPRPVAPAGGAAALPPAGRPPAAGDDRGGLSRLLPRVQRAGHGPAVRAAAAPAVAARRPRRPLPDHAHDARPGGEHRAQLLDHDDLAGLRRRNDPALPDPGRRPGVAELPRRGGRAGGGRGVHPRLRPRAVGDARQLLGGPGPGAALGAAAAVARRRPGAGLAGGAAQPGPVRRGADAGGARADRSPRAPSRPWSSSRTWAPTAAVSSTPTAPTPTRTRRR